MLASRFRIVALLAALAGLGISCSEDKSVGPPPPPPAAPSLLAVIGTEMTSFDVNWNDRSTDEFGFFVYLKRTDQDWIRWDTVAAHVGTGTVNATLSDLEVGTTYRLRVTAYNANGESASSNEVEAQTRAHNLPNPPTDVVASALSWLIVRVTWSDRGTQDSFIVQRHQLSTDWTRVGAVPDNVTEYFDSTVQQLTTYYYRVGASVTAGVVWSLDSAEVTTPQEGAPNAPDSLVTEVRDGVGVILHWRDRSVNETKFHIARQRQGEISSIIDSVAANVVTYTDTLRDSTGVFYYKVRAASDLGVSAWTTPVRADYRYCSSGVIPLCIGNYWEYAVDSAGEAYNILRQVVQAAFVDELAYYLLAQHPVPGGRVDSLYYLRNIAGWGCYAIGHPMPPNPNPGLLFAYPAVIGQYTYVEGDCVVVAGSGFRHTVRDIVYDDVVAYQRFYTRTHSMQYFVKPVTIGIIQEIEIWDGPPQIIVQRDVTHYVIQN